MTNVIAHRGASQRAAENTVEAFRMAVALGAQGVELDARRTADGAVVVHHDALVGGRPIVDLARRDLPATIPALADALDACGGVTVNIEVKNDPGEPDFDPDDTVVAAVVEELNGRRGPPERWLVSSFRLATVDRCRDLDPQIPTAWLVHSVGDDVPAMLRAHGHRAVHPWEPTVTAAVVERCHACGLEVNTWTCNDPRRAVELARWGVDGICTDVPDVLLAALAG